MPVMTNGERQKLIVEDLLSDYEKSLSAAVEWVNDYQRRQQDQKQIEQKSA